MIYFNLFHSRCSNFQRLNVFFFSRNQECQIRRIKEQGGRRLFPDEVTEASFDGVSWWSLCRCCWSGTTTLLRGGDVECNVDVV